jgi:hypothetical protein
MTESNYNSLPVPAYSQEIILIMRTIIEHNNENHRKLKK